MAQVRQAAADPKHEPAPTPSGSLTMPMIDVTAATGTFPDHSKLARDLAACMMRWEAVPDIPFFADNTAAFVHELAPESLSNASGDHNYVRINVLTPVGVLDRDKKLGVVREMTEIVAAAASCSSERAGTTTAPQSSARFITMVQTSASTWSSTLITQGAPTNNRGLPAVQPECAVPAMGWPPTKRCIRPKDCTSSSTAPFTLVTSVSGHSGAKSRMCASISGSAGTGTASTMSALLSAARVSASSMFSVASNSSNLAACTPSMERLYPKTSRPDAAAARSIEPPISPRPTTQTGVFVTLQDWHIARFARRQAGVDC